MVPHLLNNFGSLSPLHFTRMSSKAFLLLPPAAHCLWISGLTSSFPEPGLGLHIRPREAVKAPMDLLSAKGVASQARGKTGHHILSFSTGGFTLLGLKLRPIHIVLHKNPICPAMFAHDTLKNCKERKTQRGKEEKSFVKTYRLSKCAWNIMTFKIYHSDIYSHNSKRLERLLVRFSRYCEMIRITLRPHMYTRLADTSLLCLTSTTSRLAFLSTAGGIEHIL